MAVHIFIKIGDMEGEAADDAHRGKLDVLAWSWGMSQSGSMHVGEGSGSGKVNVQNLSLTKYIDKSTPILMLHCCNGKPIPECTLVARKPGENPVDYITIVMTDCLVASLSNGGIGGEERLTENVSLNFSRVKVSYQPQGKDGKAAGGAIEMDWNIQKNVQA